MFSSGRVYMSEASQCDKLTGIVSLQVSGSGSVESGEWRAENGWGCNTLSSNPLPAVCDSAGALRGVLNVRVASVLYHCLLPATVTTGATVLAPMEAHQ
ncbi:hypothetical protein PoB_006888400 [Plakobranchus ocellatus]|uniref:SRCR domain-containing protein n=1 Tax=Plakobranchus ocellatus TaxID=259542 RepID=A0AAV4DDV2_9GAST|nr:hypothetical protein PoB_006888400 [Plakobranchus ocellatus]